MALRIYYLVAFSALGLYLPYFPAWLDARGITGLALSSVMMLGPVLGAVAPVAFGLVADRLGLSGRLLTVAALGALLPVTALAVLSAVGQVTYPRILALVAVFAFFRAPLVSLADVAALESPETYARTRLHGSLGFALLALLGGALVVGAPPAALPLAVAALLAVTAVVATRLPVRSSRPRSTSLVEGGVLLRSGGFVTFLATGFLWYASHVAYDLCFSLHLSRLGAGPRALGAAWALGVGAEISFMATAPRWAALLSPTSWMALSLGVTAVRFAALSVARSVPLVFLLQPLHALTFAAFWVAALTHVRERAELRVLASAQGLFGFATSAGSAVGMLAWGPLLEARGGGAVFGASALVATLGALVAGGLALVTRAAQVRKSVAR